MTLLESIWLLVAILIIVIVLVLDPKSSITGSNSNSLLGVFSSPSSGQRFSYRLAGFLITTFFILTTVLSYFS